MLTIIVPAYNEKDGIADTLRVLSETFAGKADARLLVVDDGSTDGTAQIVEREFPEVTLIRHAANRGYGAALKTGLTHAETDLVGIIDADGTYTPESLLALYRETGADPLIDMAVGKRDWIPPSRRFAKWVLRRLARTLVGRDIPDLNSGVRVFKRDWAERFLHLYPDGFSFTTTITLAMMSSGAHVRYFPVEYKKRVGKSKIAPVRDTLNFLTLIIRSVLYFNPIKVLMPVSLGLLVIGTAVALWTLLAYERIADITVMTCYFLAIQIAVLAFIADMVARKLR